MRVRIIEPTIDVQIVKKKVCAYARVSTGSDEQGESLENQVQYYENLIALNPDYEYVDVFADRGLTGTGQSRPEFQSMLTLCREGEIDLIITKSISRFARNTTIMLEVVRELKSINVAVEFQKENINTLSGDGELMLTILSAFAQEESKNISDNQKWAIRERFKRGELQINTARFLGYDKDEYGDLVINQKEADIVEEIFIKYLSGKGVFTIAKELNDRKVPTIGNLKWHQSTIINILKNEKYKGDAHLQKYYTPDFLTSRSVKNDGQIDSYYIEGNHPAIVSKAMWDKVQEAIIKRGKAKGNTQGDRKKYQNRYPLTGMLYCSKCGYTLIRRTWNSKLSCKKIVWQCSNYIKNGKASCPGTRVDDEVIANQKITKETIVKEEMLNGKKDYTYACKSPEHKPSREPGVPEKEDGSILQGVDRPFRTVIKL